MNAGKGWLIAGVMMWVAIVPSVLVALTLEEKKDVVVIGCSPATRGQIDWREE